MTARSVVQASTAYLAVSVVEIVASLISVPVMTRLLSPADYGIMLLITNTTALVNLLFGFSLAQALPTLSAANASAQYRRTVSTTILWSIAILSAVVHGGMILAAGSIYRQANMPAGVDPPIALAGLASFAVAMSLCLASLARVRERALLVACVQIPVAMMQLGLLLYGLVIAHAGLAAPYFATSAGGLFAIACYAWFLRDGLTGRFDGKILRAAAHIAVRVLPWQLAVLLTTNTGGFFLIRGSHVEDAGMFAVAASLVAVLVSLANSFNSAWTPYVLNRHEDAGVAQTQRQVFELYSSGLMISACGLALFAQEIFSILLGPAFQPAFHFVPPLLLANSLFCFAQAFSQGLQAKQHMRAYAGIGTAVAAVFLACSLALTSRFGAYGLIAAMGTAFLTMLVLLQRTSERLMPVGYPWWRHGLMWSVAIGTVGVTYPLGMSWQGFAVKACVALAMAALPFAFAAISLSDVRRLISGRLGFGA